MTVGFAQTLLHGLAKCMCVNHHLLYVTCFIYIYFTSVSGKNCASFRNCKEPNHIPLRCDEVEKPDEVKARIYIEDRMTEALVR